MNEHKTREAGLRRMASRQGLQVKRSRSRTPEVYEYGTYLVVDPDTNFVVHMGLASGYGLDLDHIEASLREPKAVAL